MKNTKNNRFYYGYVIVAAAFLMEAINIGANNSFGLFIAPLQAEFGWSRALVSGAASLAMLASSAVIILWGVLCDKFGPRLILSTTGAVTAAGFLLMSQVNSVWQIYLFYGIIIGLTIGSADLISLSIVARWFKSNVGIMSGIAKVGAGAGMLLIPLMVNGLMSSINWRASYIALGCLYLILVVGAAQFTRLNPAQAKNRINKTDAFLPPESGLTLRQALKTRQLWTACFLTFAYLCGAQTVIIHIAPHALNLGLSTDNAALSLSILGGVSILGRVIMGWTGDKLGNRTAMSITIILVCLALIGFQLYQLEWLIFVLSALFGFGHGGFAALISPKMADIFGIRAHGAIFGTAMLFGSIGCAIGPLMGGILFDTQGNYQLVFAIVTFLMVITLLLNMSLKRAKWQTG